MLGKHKEEKDNEEEKQIKEQKEDEKWEEGCYVYIGLRQVKV